jgi:hypothetical protein
MTAPAVATSAGGLIATSGANSVVQRTPNAAQITAGESTTSTSYTATLTNASTGPSVTVACGPRALVAFHTRQITSVNNINAWTSYTISAPTNLAASDNWAVSYDVVGTQVYHGLTLIEPNVTAGTNTFTMQYRVGGSATATFGSRRINVVPF